MTIDELKKAIKDWHFSRYKFINFFIGISALLIYELIGLPYYRPYIYAHKIYDFHIADTLGNSLGTITIIFMLIFLLSNEKSKGKPLIVIGTMIAAVFEIAHPLLGKPIDSWDILATLVTGMISFLAFDFLFKSLDEKGKKLNIHTE